MTTRFALQTTACLVGLLTAAGCASFKPNPKAQASFRERALEMTNANFCVQVAVLSPEEAAKYFDRKLHKKDIQPVWLSIQNRGPIRAFLLPRMIDSQYYSPLEVAYQYRSGWRPKRNQRVDTFFLTNSMALEIPPGTTRSGFIFTHVDLGSKHVPVSLLNTNGLQQFSCTPRIPGLRPDWEKVPWDDLARQVETTECDEARLRAELERLPRAVTDKSGRNEGDPLNLVIVASPKDLEAFAWSSWDETERITSGSAWRTFKSFLFGSEYRYSPISSLYVFGRPQDIALQKARGSIHLRNHLRLWVTPFRFASKNVWIGQISRDIGVRWTFKSPSLTTHKIDPDVDETRTYLIQDLLLSQGLLRFGFVKGVQPAPFHAPRANLTGDPYYTDGLRAVIELTSEPTDMNEIRLLDWENPPSQNQKL